MVKRNTKIIFIVTIVILVIGLLTNPSNAQVDSNDCYGKYYTQVCNGDCDGNYKGRRPTEEELKQILADHAEWLKILTEAIIKAGNAIGTPAEVAEAVPQEGRANLCKVDLSDFDLSSLSICFDLRHAKLCGADLSCANLSESLFGFADLRGVNLYRSDLSESHLMSANLHEGWLKETNLSGAGLSFANLSDASLENANLSNACLNGANLSNAFLKGVNLSDTDLWMANMDSVIFELNPGTLHKIRSIARAKNLYKMRYVESPHSLVELCAKFKEMGLRQQERETTYAIERTRRQLQMWSEWKGKVDVAEFTKGFFKLILFELTCDYGMSPGRPLWIMGGFFLVFFIPYMIALNTQGRAGIWQHWEKDRVLKNDGQDVPVRLHGNKCKLRGIWIAIYFSLLSAFHIGWRELNIGHWIIRMQRHEFILKATGWARTVSGVQSVISVYLLALSVLSYFGRPFE